MGKTGQRECLSGLLSILLAAIVSSSSLAQIAGPLAQKAADDASEIAASARERGYVRVLVELAGTMEIDSVAADAARMAVVKSRVQAIQKAVIATHFGSVAQSPAARGSFARSFTLFDLTPVFAVNASLAEIERLAADSRVIRIERDRAFKPQLSQSVPLMGMTGPGGVYSYGGTGRGQAVAIIDTGVRKTHPFLAGKVIQEACFSTTSGTLTNLCPSGTNPGPNRGLDCRFTGCDHGTHVAGIAAGFNTSPHAGQPLNGVAKDAKIVSVQVFSRQNDPHGCDHGRAPCIAAFGSDIGKGLEFVLQHLRPANIPIAAVNVSLGANAGGLVSNAPCDSAFPLTQVARMMSALRAANVPVVSATGNNSCGGTGCTNAVAWPACISKAIAVGATTKDLNLAPFGNRGALVDILAPGARILSSVPPAGYSAWDGTSMAAPHISGLIAAIRSIDPNATASKIESVLKAKAISVTDSATGITMRRVNGAPVGVEFAPPWLKVTPDTATAFTGETSFSPTSSAYQVSTSRSSVTYSVTGLPSWLTATPLTGTARVASAPVSFAINTTAAARLAPGTHAATVTFQNVTNGRGTQSRNVSLNINRPHIVPPTCGWPPPPEGCVTLYPSGDEGGPFAPASTTFQLAASSRTLDYTVDAPVWATASVGTLTTTPQDVTITLNSNVNALPAGVHRGTVLFRPTNGAAPYGVGVTVTVRPGNDSFEKATPLYLDQPIAGRTQNAATQAGEPVDITFDQSVWFKFRAPAAGDYRVITSGAASNYVNQVYTGSAVNALTLVPTPPFSGLFKYVVFTATSGQLFYIRVAGHQDASFDIVVDQNIGGLASYPFPLLREDIVVFTTPGGTTQPTTFGRQVRIDVSSCTLIQNIVAGLAHVHAFERGIKLSGRTGWSVWSRRFFI